MGRGDGVDSELVRGRLNKLGLDVNDNDDEDEEPACGTGLIDAIDSPL
jgi:hypothetical protein